MAHAHCVHGSAFDGRTVQPALVWMSGAHGLNRDGNRWRRDDGTAGRRQVAGPVVRHQEDRAASSSARRRRGATGSPPTAAPAPGRTRGFKAEPGRYHLYVSLACPWAHRTLIFRALKKLEDVISVSVVHHFMGKDGWTFLAEDGATGDTLYGMRLPAPDLHAAPIRTITGRVTVPVLWDKQQQTIVSNEFVRDHPHAELGLRRLGRCRARFLSRGAARRDRRDQRAWSIRRSTTASIGPASPPRRTAYEEAFDDAVRGARPARAAPVGQRYLVGDAITEADWRLFTTLVRFDPVYVGHFKCNLRRIADYPNLSNYLRDLYQVPGVAETVNLHHIKAHYYGSHDDDQPDPHRARSAGARSSTRRTTAAASADGPASRLTSRARRPRRRTPRRCAGASPASCPRGRASSGKKPASAISWSGCFGAVCVKSLDEIEGDMVAPARAAVEMHRPQHRRRGEVDVAFLLAFALAAPPPSSRRPRRRRPATASRAHRCGG